MFLASKKVLSKKKKQP